MYPLQFHDPLPVLPIPLLRPDPDVPLESQAAVAAVYERGGYADLIDYQNAPPLPALTEVESKWLDEHLQSPRALVKSGRHGNFQMARTGAACGAPGASSSDFYGAGNVE